MDKTARLVLTIAGHNRVIAPDVLLVDLARKLRGLDLGSGQHEILIFGDGSIVLNMALVWEPPKAPPMPQQPRRKVG